jgi:hypothetical protein
MSGDESVPGSFESGATPKQGLVHRGAFTRVVEAADDLVELTLTFALGGLGIAAAGGIEKGRLAEHIELAHVEHMADLGAAMMVVDRLGLACRELLLEPTRGRWAAILSWVDDDLEPHIGRALGVGQRSPIAYDDTGDHRGALGQAAGLAPGAAGSDTVVGDLDRTVELVEGHHRGCRDLGAGRHCDDHEKRNQRPAFE